MEIRTLGRTGIEVTLCGVGTWAMGASWGPQEDADSRAALHRSLDLGCRFIDTAQSYGQGRSERLIGEVLRERGEHVPVATKVPPKNRGWGPPKGAAINEHFPTSYIVEQCDESLRRLQVEQIDVYQLHTWLSDWNDTDEFPEAVETLRRQGKVRAFGISVPDGDPACANGMIRRGFVDTIQVVYNILDQEARKALFPLASEHGVGIIVRVPLASGALTGRFTRETTFADEDWRQPFFRGTRFDRLLRDVETVRQAVGDSMPLAHAALRFAGSDPAVATVIPGARNARQAQENAAAFDPGPLPSDLLARLQELDVVAPAASPSDARYRDEI